ncbi:iron-siderophore ABC transporter substrate-binding protein [Actinotalea sp. K2]|uniref:iron-siderophore ABC transporter substrate-binding protein n=1 Tax=Actinotalea sp. K2 TaxID=2939438 RepID=UPI002017092A|nr:iron-siderophore ABC transporter substrate-binding protein [Actinotalea sp. K2]MCL3861161.1 iron-siderophore ABC transporter substrate-binding protein [Actinotalea sp. K2]
MRASRLFTTATAVAALSILAACGSTGEADVDATAEPTSAAQEGVFPVTIPHAFGETTVDAQPVRVATVAWSNHEVPLALGIVPVGMAAATWGDDDDNGVLPWVEDALAELGAELPVLFDETDGIDFEGVANTQPDLILATYSGLTEEDYATLSSIAPTIAYPEVAWGTSHQDMITISSAALGMAEEGEALVADLDAQVAEALAANPALDGAKVLFSYIDPSDFSQIGFYTSHDTRPGFLLDAGLPMPAVVEEETAGTDAFYVTVSAEEADRFDDVDLFVTYGDASSDIVAQLQADPLLSTIPAIAEGRVAVLENSTPLAASANPSPLSIGWGVQDYLALLAAPLAD